MYSRLPEEVWHPTAPTSNAPETSNKTRYLIMTIA